MNLNYRYYQSQIVENQNIDPETLITTYKAGNAAGGQRFGSYVGFGFPIVKTKFSVYFNTSPSFSKSITLIDDRQTETNRLEQKYSINLDITPVDWFSAYIGSNFR